MMSQELFFYLRRSVLQFLKVIHSSGSGFKLQRLSRGGKGVIHRRPLVAPIAPPDYSRHGTRRASDRPQRRGPATSFSPARETLPLAHSTSASSRRLTEKFQTFHQNGGRHRESLPRDPSAVQSGVNGEGVGGVGRAPTEGRGDPVSAGGSAPALARVLPSRKEKLRSKTRRVLEMRLRVLTTPGRVNSDIRGSECWLRFSLIVTACGKCYYSAYAQHLNPYRRGWNGLDPSPHCNLTLLFSLQSGQD
ncbi:uncharacterized protein LOC132403368 [Hypanus sabinus]|uniref:uncharacterized protein LOC132403368 n=1 Tax=Hypanus sabinus TaxID=79690 RepID=UPI0028C46F13|nr:uncharacterized protein LOC132403368 [Hypanus sabinus]